MTLRKPEVTIVITTRDRSELAKRALASALAQTFQDFEVVIVDDSSTPPFQLELADPRVSVVRRSASHGVSAARSRPRAVAYSWQRITAATPSGSRAMPRHGAAASSANWVMYNLGAAFLRSRAGESGVLVRYEDLVRAPRRSVSLIAETLQGKETGVPFADGHTVELPPNHAFAGNPSRLPARSRHSVR